MISGRCWIMPGDARSAQHSAVKTHTSMSYCISYSSYAKSSARHCWADDDDDDENRRHDTTTLLRDLRKQSQYAKYLVHVLRTRSPAMADNIANGVTACMLQCLLHSTETLAKCPVGWRSNLFVTAAVLCRLVALYELATSFVGIERVALLGMMMSQ